MAFAGIEVLLVNDVQKAGSAENLLGDTLEAVLDIVSLRWAPRNPSAWSAARPGSAFLICKPKAGPNQPRIPPASPRTAGSGCASGGD